MRRWLALLLALAAGACSSSPVRIESRALAGQLPESPDRFIVAAVDNDPNLFVAHAGSTPRGYDGIASYGPSQNARQTMRSLENDYRLREVSAWPIAPLHMHCAVLEIPDGVDRKTLLTAMAQDRRIRLAQPLQSFATRTEVYNDPYVGLQRGFQQMDVAEAHAWSRGEGVKIAIIDTGADVEHADLRANIAAAVNFVDSDDGQFRRDRHGTEMAGVVAAVANNRQGIVGIAPAAHLLLFKACWQLRQDADAARCNTFTLARALVAAFDAHAQIVNLSLAGPADPLLRDLIREGLRRGVLFVGAAPADSGEGKEGLLSEPGVIEVASAGGAPASGAAASSPAAASNSVASGPATSSSAASNPAASSDALHAPGREILTLLPGGRYDFASGDSIATAQVSGVLALILAKTSGISAADAYRLLRDTSAPDGAGGAGALVDACAAVVSLVGRGSCNPKIDDAHDVAKEREQRMALH